MRRQRAAVAAVLLVAVAALAGCDGVARPDPSATELPDGISAVLVPSSVADEAIVRITNATDEELSIGSLQIDDPRFAWAAWSRAAGDRTVRERSISLISVRLPDARCSTAGHGATRITVQYALGASIAVASAAIDDPSGVVTALTASQCGAG